MGKCMLLWTSNILVNVLNVSCREENMTPITNTCLLQNGNFTGQVKMMPALRVFTGPFHSNIIGFSQYVKNICEMDDTVSLIASL